MMLRKTGAGMLLTLLIVAGCVLTSGTTQAQEPRFLDKDPYHWIDQLSNKKPAARRAAAFALGKLGTATYTYQGIVPLVEHLGGQESEPEVRDAAAYALGEIGLALRRHRESAAVWRVAGGSLLQALSHDKDPRVRRSAAYAIGGFGRIAAIAARAPLRTALQDKAAGVRQNAAWALGQLGKEEAAETLSDLSKLFGDADPQVRRDAAAAVGEIGRLRGADEKPLPNPAIAPLLELFKKEKDATIRQVALDALVNAVTPEDKPIAADLRQLLRDENPEIVRAAALALGNIGGAEADEAVRVLRRALTEGNKLTRIQASAALANIGEGAAAAVRDLTDALEDQDDEIRRNAAFALGRIGAKAAAAVPALAKHLHADEPNEEVRKFAAEALAQMNGDDIVAAVPALINAMQNDKSSPVRQRCVWAVFNVDLIALHVVEPLTALLSETGDQNALVRYDAARCLGLRLGGKAPEKAVDVLVEMLKDKRLKVYEGSGADVTGSSVEGVKGGAKVATNLGGDARFLAAQALARIGRPKASHPDVLKALKEPDVLKLLEEAGKSSDPMTRNAADEALRFIRGKK